MYNYLGDVIAEDNYFIPYKPEFLDENGNPKWREYIKNGDENGFDITFKFEDGNYKRRIVLPCGKRIIRFGRAARGRFTTDYGTPYEKLSLSYKPESMEYHEYEVVSEVQVECIVEEGRVAPGFLSDGGAVQYMHDHSIKELLKTGVLKEDLSWITRKR